MFLIVPTEISDKIDARLDAAIKKHPKAEADRAVLRAQLIDFVDAHGYVPDFDLEPKSWPVQGREGAPKSTSSG